MDEKDMLDMAKCQLELEKDFQKLLEIIGDQEKRIKNLEEK